MGKMSWECYQIDKDDKGGWYLVGETGILTLCRWECDMMQPFREQQYLTNI